MGRDEKPSQSVRPKPRLPPSEGRGFDSRPRSQKRPLNRRPPPMLKRLEKEPMPPKRKLEPYKKNVNIRLPKLQKQELKPMPPQYQSKRREETAPKRLRHPEKKPALKKRPTKHIKSPIKTVVTNPALNVDEFSAPAAPIKLNKPKVKKRKPLIIIKDR